MRSALKATLIGGCMAILAGGAAYATGGAGGMGGGSMQQSGRDGDLQSNTSRYDPATEGQRLQGRRPGRRARDRRGSEEP